MEYLSLDTLKSNLMSCPEQLEISKQIITSEPGVMYLYNNLYLKLSEGKTVLFGELDYTQFDLDDIESIYDIYIREDSVIYTLNNFCNSFSKMKAHCYSDLFI